MAGAFGSQRATTFMKVRLMTKLTLLVFGPILLATLAGCAGQPQPSSSDGSRSVTVMCNSTVGYDTGFCQLKANEACGHRARLAGIISNIEMTGRPTGQLYTITARYQCGSN